MIPRETIAKATIPGGGSLSLIRRGDDYVINLGSEELMGTRMRFSEEQLAHLTIDQLAVEDARLLIGGYGMGFTYRAALSRISKRGEVVAYELVPEILDWARGPLAHLTEKSLDDPRGNVVIDDVGSAIASAADGTTARYDAILLDVDNGPDGIVREENEGLYGETGLAKARAALHRGGVISIWSANPDPRFTKRLKQAGFSVEERVVRARPNNKGPRHTIWFAHAS